MLKNDSNVSINIGGMGFVLFVVFLVLKLINVIDWSWWWVTSPLWIPVAFVIGVLAVVGLTVGFVKFAISAHRK